MGGHSPPSAWIAPLSLRDRTASARGGKGQCPSAEPFPGLLCVILDLGAIGSAVAEAGCAQQSSPATSSPAEGLSNI